MSTQLAHTAKSSGMYLETLDGSSMSNSQIVQATNEAFSLHQRLDVDHKDCNHEISSNPLGAPTTSRLQLRKRRKDFESARSDYTAADFNTDFLSGIFRDISQAAHVDDEEDESVGVVTNSNERSSGCISDYEYTHTRKRAKIHNTDRKSNSFRPSRRSLASLNTLCANQVESDIYGSEAQVMVSPNSMLNQRVTQARRVSVGSQKVSLISAESPYQTVLMDTNCINNLVDKVLDESLIFPRLPPTVSESSCNSNNLTQTSVRAAQVNETLSSSNIEGESKDTYGWFVDTDLEEDSCRADAITAAQATCRASMDEDLSFKAFTAPKKTSELDDEVEWAKAADTVDDVLGDFF